MQSNSDEDWGQDASWEQTRLLTQTMHMSVEHVMRLISSGSLDLTPDYLRIGRWEIRRQSRLIESLLLNMPVPPIYLAEESRGRYVIIDGYQRLTAIYQYLTNEFRLQGVDVLPELRNRSFEELGPELRTALEMQLITVVVIPRQTSSFVRYEVFLRLNTGGKPLSVQQVRMAAFPGPLNDALIRFSQDDFLWGQLKASARRDMTDVAYVLRFLSMAHMDDPWTHPTQRILDEFMATHAHDSPDEIDSYREWFQRSIRACEAIWGEHAFKRYRYPRWLDRVVAEIYDIQMIACHISSDEILEKARGKASQATKKMARLLDRPPFSDHHRPTSKGFEATHAIRMVQELLGELAAE